MRIVVTGAGGFVGRHLVTYLASSGHDVLALAREGDDQPLEAELPDEASARTTVLTGSLHDDDFLRESVHGADAVVHLAAKRRAPTEGELVSVNGKLTGRLASAAARNDTTRRFVYLSCLPAASPDPPTRRRPTRRKARSTNLSRYARSKRLGEERVLALAEELPVTIIRAPLIYGPGDRSSLEMFQRMKRRVVPLPARGRDALSIIFVRDLCEALHAAVVRDHASGSIFEVSDATVTWREFTEAVGEALGRHPRALGVPYWVFSLANKAVDRPKTRPRPAPLMQNAREWRQRSWTCDSEDIQTALGWKPATPPAEGIAKTTLWYRDAGWL